MNKAFNEMDRNRKIKNYEDKGNAYKQKGILKENNGEEKEKENDPFLGLRKI